MHLIDKLEDLPKEGNWTVLPDKEEQKEVAVWKPLSKEDIQKIKESFRKGMYFAPIINAPDN